jgi:hypothetical protein
LIGECNKLKNGDRYIITKDFDKETYKDYIRPPKEGQIVICNERKKMYNLNGECVCDARDIKLEENARYICNDIDVRNKQIAYERYINEKHKELMEERELKKIDKPIEVEYYERIRQINRFW